MLDVAGFERAHPGGAFVIEHNIGRDVSKFFWGGYALTGNTPDPTATVSRIAHSNVAIKIANDLAVARLCRQSTPRMLARIDTKMTNKVNKHTSTFFFKANFGTSNEMHDTSTAMIPHNATDHETNLNSVVKSFYGDLSTIGKHFLIGTTIEGKTEESIHNLRDLWITNKIRRHYTIASAMMPDFQAELMKAIQCLIDGQSATFSEALLAGTPGTIPLTIKGYPVGGLSQQAHVDRP